METICVYYTSKILRILRAYPDILGGSESFTKKELCVINSLKEKGAVNCSLNFLKELSNKFDSLEDNLVTEKALGCSSLSLDRLSYGIMDSTTEGGVATTSFTKYNCLFCGCEALHSSSDVPKLCKECSTKIATHIIKNLDKYRKRGLVCEKTSN